MASKIAQVAENLGLNLTQRHIFLCVKSTPQSCCDGALALQSWEYLKSKLKELKLSERGGIQRTKPTVLGYAITAQFASYIQKASGIVIARQQIWI